MAGKKVSGQAHGGKKYFDVELSFSKNMKLADFAKFLRNELSGASSIEILRIMDNKTQTDMSFLLRIWEAD